MKHVITLFLFVFSFNLQAATIRDNLTVALTILGEARNQGEYGMSAVAQVISNRAKYNKTSPATECIKNKQFSFWNEPRNKEYLQKLFYTKEGKIAWELAGQINDGLIVNFEVLGCLNYHTKEVSPAWANKLIRCAVIKDHIFYKNS